MRAPFPSQSTEGTTHSISSSTNKESSTFPTSTTTSILSTISTTRTSCNGCDPSCSAIDCLEQDYGAENERKCLEKGCTFCQMPDGKPWCYYTEGMDIPGQNCHDCNCLERVSCNRYDENSCKSSGCHWCPREGEHPCIYGNFQGTTTTTTTTTIDPTFNQCFGYDCGGGVCFEIDDIPTCIDATIGFLSHDKKMTVKCGDGTKNQKWMKTKMLNDNGIHHVDFEATPRKHEYIIHTHLLYADKKPTQAMYCRNNTDDNYTYVNHIRTDGADLSKYGNTWLIERITCDDAECPYTVRAAEDQTRGWKNNIDGGYNWLRVMEIDLNNEDFLWWIEIQEF
ncbi:Oidioi.mRNA.OKI2018_I69.XSR.g16694.t1.cds [Oikopleura dioica]|uniref:Oidioi.mRNA.OKI2018_I69.XSR.g16694.t1.cds n=1 Tax=Oikopleura dioica TaxID=34765 RepID=A0ABN7SP89_OIKDI|nr:Oidioi.mRNA.OKI2018_I69.XSR.g16694.t1.cds [Oikopleura dioica]